jgi:hypothetical protein
MLVPVAAVSSTNVAAAYDLRFYSIAKIKATNGCLPAY